VTYFHHCKELRVNDTFRVITVHRKTSGLEYVFVETLLLKIATRMSYKTGLLSPPTNHDEHGEVRGNNIKFM
jgi:hypothetical protein